MAPSSSAVVCLTTWRTGEQTGARATVTTYPRAVRHGNHCHSPDIRPGQRRRLSAPAAGLCLSHSLQLNTSGARLIHVPLWKTSSTNEDAISPGRHIPWRSSGQWSTFPHEKMGTEKEQEEVQIALAFICVTMGINCIASSRTLIG
ncbi:hypothetical protein PAMA_017589 [Pampus argenteus]